MNVEAEGGWLTTDVTGYGKYRQTNPILLQLARIGIHPKVEKYAYRF